MEKVRITASQIAEAINEMSDIQVLKITAPRLGKITTVSDEELEYVDYIMFTMGEVAKKTRFNKLSAVNKMKILELVAKEGLDTSLFFTDTMKEVTELPPTTPSEPSQLPVARPVSIEKEPESLHPTLFQKAVDPLEILPALDASKPSDSLRITLQNESKSFKSHNMLENVLDAYETQPYEKERLDDEPPPMHHRSKPANPSMPRKYRESPSPIRIYNIRSKSRGRSGSRSPSKSPVRSRSKERGRYRARSRSKSRGRYRERSRSRGRYRDRYY